VHRIQAGLAACLAAAVTVGCGSVQAPAAHPARHSATPATARGPAGSAGCHGGASAITQADSGKTFCVRVGDKVAVLLRSGDSHLWLPPLASGSALKRVPSGEASLVRGVTGAWFSAVGPGRVFVTSVRPPCEVAVTAGKGGLQPSDPLPKSYPLRFCAPGHRFSVSIVVAR
jgi:hypothetical protein